MKRLAPGPVGQLGDSETLRQASFEVGDFFNYRAGWVHDGHAGIDVCRVGIAFTTIAIMLASAELVRRLLVTDGASFLGDFKRLQM